LAVWFVGRYGDRHSDEETAMAKVSENYERAKSYANGDIAYGDAAATAQVSAMLAVADEIRALREAVEDLGKDIRSLDEAPSSLSDISDWLKTIAERR
jgi:hypothetical protein